jgi:hypothetical protein
MSGIQAKRHHWIPGETGEETRCIDCGKYWSDTIDHSEECYARRVDLAQ